MKKIHMGLTADEYFNGFCEDELAVKHYNKEMKQLSDRFIKVCQLVEELTMEITEKQYKDLTPMNEKTLKLMEHWWNDVV